MTQLSDQAQRTSARRGIEVRGVTKTYGKTAVVKDVSCDISAGQITSIIGPNGAGKSTLLSMISRLLPLDAGRVSVDGLDVAGTPSKILARKLAILRQENQFQVRLTVRDLVGFGRFPYSQGRPGPDDQEKIDEAIAFLDLQDLEHRFLDQLSGGQRQRAYVAMVLCQDTDYILLDEPLNNLDMKHAVNMMKLLRRAAETLGKTVVLVIHDINFAASYSDSIIAMRDGEIVHQGPTAELMTEAVLREVFDLDIRIIDVDGVPLGVYFS
ncbi:ABC transporter ATP-binding protein [Saxibacter everestensis]|uniref:ABC transporter ATP-binding protein n=1 Tax=Saxibacter everestensis TaxID=2909229 RepID=A0ABY8QRZ1_9MICO|nr:ABC transporter ATP-binding protein [Brevibacteriaceae bacterium ZFBP1038]